VGGAAPQFARRSVAARVALPLTLTLVVCFIGLGLYFYRAGSAPPVGDKKSIAVLPLKPISAANRDEMYEVGIADSLIYKLGAIKAFVVRPLSAVRKYADINQDPIAAGREQQVDYVLASNYQLAGGKIRVTSELLNVASGEIVETYKSGEKETGNVFATQDQIAVEVGNLLLMRFNFKQNNPTKKRGTDNEEAYRLYLQGVYFNDKRFPQDGLKAVEFFEQAVRLDPNYARAWAGVAFSHRSLSDIGADVDIHEQHRISMEAVKKALELDPNLSEAYNALCMNKLNYEYDVSGAESACRRAIELDPNSPLAHNTYARLLFSSQSRRFDEAIAEIKTAIDLDPTSIYHQIVYMFALTIARRYDEAAQQLERLAQRNPQRAVGYYWIVGGVAFQGKQAEDFERLMRFRKLSNVGEETDRIFETAYQTAGWQGVLREQAKWSYQFNRSMYFTACIYAQAGDKDKALEYLEKTYQRREHWMAYLQVDPRFDSLRGDPRYDALVKRLRL
jgi:TolB-like protein